MGQAKATPANSTTATAHRPPGREGSSQPAPLAQLQLLSNAEAIDETWRLALKCTTTQWLFDDFRQYE